jgi:hypothetical protein
MDAATIQLLITTIDALQTSRYTSAAAVAIYLYNIFLTFDLEVRSGPLLDLGVYRY